MTPEQAGDVQWLLGPPADPELRARFDAAQRALGERSPRETALLLEPRLRGVVTSLDGEPSALDELLSCVVGEPVRVTDPQLGFGFMKGKFVATLALLPRGLSGSRVGIERLFGDPEIPRAIASALGLLFKLDWVLHLRTPGRTSLAGPARDDRDQEAS